MRGTFDRLGPKPMFTMPTFRQHQALAAISHTGPAARCALVFPNKLLVQAVCREKAKESQSVTTA